MLSGFTHSTRELFVLCSLNAAVDIVLVPEYPRDMYCRIDARERSNAADLSPRKG
jgi:hypothetical protein